MYYLRIQKIVLEQPLASAYMLHLYKSHWLYISEENLINFRELGLLEDSEVYCY